MSEPTPSQQPVTKWKSHLRTFLPALICFACFFVIEPLWRNWPEIRAQKIKPQWSLALGTKHTLGIDALAFTPDGHKLMVSDYDDRLFLIDRDQGKTVKQRQTRFGASAIAIPPPGHPAYLFMGVLERVTAVDPDSLEGVKPLKITPENDPYAPISRDGKLLISYGASHPPRVWDLKTDQRVTTLGTKIAHCADLSPDGARALACYEDGSFSLWDAQHGRALKTFPAPDTEDGHHAYLVAFTPDSQRAVVSYLGMTGVWDLTSGKLLNTFETPFFYPSDRLIVTPDGQGIIAFYTREIRMYRIADGRLIARFNDTPAKRDDREVWVSCLALSQDGRTLASGDMLGRVAIYPVPEIKP